MLLWLAATLITHTLQHVVHVLHMCGGVLLCLAATRISRTLCGVAVCCSVLLCVAVKPISRTLQCVAVSCSVLQRQPQRLSHVYVAHCCMCVTYVLHVCCMCVAMSSSNAYLAYVCVKESEVVLCRCVNHVTHVNESYHTCE